MIFAFLDSWLENTKCCVHIKIASTYLYFRNKILFKCWIDQEFSVSWEIVYRWVMTNCSFVLYLVDRASRYKFLLVANWTHFFIYLFISSLYMFRSSQCSSSGDRIVLIHHLVWLVCVSDCLVCRSGGNCSSLLTGIPSSHLPRLINHARWCLNTIRSPDDEHCDDRNM